MHTQKQEILEFVEARKRGERTIKEMLASFSVSPSSFYRWRKQQAAGELQVQRFTFNPRLLTPWERERILAVKAANPALRHRRIQGELQKEGLYISEEYIKSGRINFVMATELSRLSRSVIDFLKLFELCSKHNVDVMVIGLDHFDTSTAVGKVLIIILVALAAFEREMTGERVRANAYIRLIKDGRINGGAPVLGLERDPSAKDQYMASPEGLAAAEKILKLFLKVSSKKKLLELAKELGIMGRKGTDLTDRELDYMLMNVKWRYRGLWFANDENMGIDDDLLPENKRFRVVPLKHGPVIDIELLDAVQAKLKDTYDKRKRQGKSGYTYLLSNVLFYEDGSPMKGEPGKKGRYRWYRSKKAKVKAHCAPLDKKIVERLKLMLTDNEKFQELIAQAIQGRDVALAKIDAEMYLVEKELARCEKQNAELRDQLFSKLGVSSAESGASPTTSVSDPMFLSWLKEQVKTLQEEQERLEKQLRFLRDSREDVLKRTGLSSLRETVREFVNSFDKLSRTERRNLLEKIVKRVVLKRENRVELYLAVDPNLVPPSSVMRRNQSSDNNLNGVANGFSVSTGSSCKSNAALKQKVATALHHGCLSHSCLLWSLSTVAGASFGSL